MIKNLKYKPLQDPFESFQESQKQQGDLTAKFIDIAIRNNSYNFKPDSKNEEIEHENKNFFKETSQLVSSIKLSVKRLNELDILFQRSGLFNNEDDKINELMNLIKEVLHKYFMNKSIGEIQSSFNVVQQQQNNCRSKNSQNLRKNIVETIQGRFIEVTNKFSKSLQNRQTNLKKREARKALINPSSKEQLTRRMNFTKEEEKSSDDTVIQVHADQKYYNQRTDSMKNIQKMLNDIGQAFQRLGTIVRLHEVMIDRIDKNTEDSLINVEKGRKSLSEAYRNISSNRALIIKIVLIMIVFATIYILFLV